MPQRARITDVGPRDGLQNEPGVIAPGEKARLVDLIGATGADEIEVSSFVSPKWVPQLGDAAEVFRLVAELRKKDTESGRRSPLFSALVPNGRGMESLLEVNADAGGEHPLIGKASVFTAASESFSQRNTNASIAETLERFRPVIESAHEAALPVRGYVSCAIACPFEGAIDPERVARVAIDLLELGVDEIDLGDTIGTGTPESVRVMLATVREYVGIDAWGGDRVTLHLHDTFGNAAACVRAALDEGVRSFDGSAGGLGGCPYASTPERRAPGNIATDTLVRTIHDAGYETGVDLDALAEASRYAADITTGSGAS